SMLRAKSRCTCCSSVISAGTASTLAPWAANSAAVRSSSAAPRAVRVSAAPSAARARAAPLPMPLLPPVINATLPASLVMRSASDASPFSAPTELVWVERRLLHSPPPLPHPSPPPSLSRWSAGFCTTGRAQGSSPPPRDTRRLLVFHHPDALPL